MLVLTANIKLLALLVQWLPTFCHVHSFHHVSDVHFLSFFYDSRDAFQQSGCYAVKHHVICD